MTHPPRHAADEPPASPTVTRISFPAQIELLQFFLAHRHPIVERVEGVLNAQRKPLDYLRDVALLSRQFEDAFFTVAGLTDSQASLRGRLEDAYRASGFNPRRIHGLYNSLVEPAEMMMRGFHLWRETRWPGRAGRIRYAQTLFNVYVLRCLELLALHLWDDEASLASDRLARLQQTLDQLWRESPPDQPALVRDARWLIQLAQSPATDDLGAYFEVARNVAGTLSQEDRIEIHKAGVRMAGAHLRSQIRYHSTKKDASLDERNVILSTRHSNALDFALLVQELVPLLEAYDRACQSADERTRLELADAICQGISPDPDLFLNAPALLGAYTMLEHLFVTIEGNGRVVHTPTGRRHVELLHRYAGMIGRVSKRLADDASRFRPTAGTYSPYGVLYGFTTNLIEHMVFKTLQPDSLTRFSLEDVFTGGDDSGEKLAWVSGWRKLPHLSREVAAQFDYPQQFAEDAFVRVEQALRTRVSNGEARTDAAVGRLYIFPADHQAVAETSPVPDLPVRYIRSSDSELVAARQARADDEAALLTDRREGKLVLSYKTAGGWVGISKAMLTEVLAAGRDAKITGLPAAVIAALRLMYPDLVVCPGPENEPGVI